MELVQLTQQGSMIPSRKFGTVVVHVRSGSCLRRTRRSLRVRLSRHMSQSHTLLARHFPLDTCSPPYMVCTVQPLRCQWPPKRYHQAVRHSPHVGNKGVAHASSNLRLTHGNGEVAPSGQKLPAVHLNGCTVASSGQ